MHSHTQRLFFAVEYELIVVCQIFNDAALKVIVKQDITHLTLIIKLEGMSEAQRKSKSQVGFFSLNVFKVSSSHSSGKQPEPCICLQLALGQL